VHYKFIAFTAIGKITCWTVDAEEGHHEDPRDKANNKIQQEQQQEQHQEQQQQQENQAPRKKIRDPKKIALRQEVRAPRREARDSKIDTLARNGTCYRAVITKRPTMSIFVYKLHDSKYRSA
jgi:hypothetical protein